MQPLVPLAFHNLPSLYPPSFRFVYLAFDILVVESQNVMKMSISLCDKVCSQRDV